MHGSDLQLALQASTRWFTVEAASPAVHTKREVKDVLFLSSIALFFFSLFFFSSLVFFFSHEPQHGNVQTAQRFDPECARGSMRRTRNCIKRVSVKE